MDLCMMSLAQVSQQVTIHVHTGETLATDASGILTCTAPSAPHIARPHQHLAPAASNCAPTTALHFLPCAQRARRATSAACCRC